MKTRETKPAITRTVTGVGIIVVMLVMVLGTMWTGQKASRDTESAVRNVSLLYLDELAGRREQVVEENLNDRIFDMRTALDLMTEDDLQDEAHRQAYQKKMKALFILEKFAFVDEEGKIYTSMGSRKTLTNTISTMLHWLTWRFQSRIWKVRKKRLSLLCLWI